MTLTVMNMRKCTYQEIESVAPQGEANRAIVELRNDSLGTEEKKYVIRDELAPSGFGVVHFTLRGYDYFHIPMMTTAFLLRFGWGHAK